MLAIQSVMGCGLAFDKLLRAELRAKLLQGGLRAKLLRGGAGRGGTGRDGTGRGGAVCGWQHLRCGLVAGQVTAVRGGAGCVRSGLRAELQCAGRAAGSDYQLPNGFNAYSMYKLTLCAVNGHLTQD